MGDAGAWAHFPWADPDGKQCPHPAAPGDFQRQVVILGDSLVRPIEGALVSGLERRGIGAVVVCWGGKQTTWGLDQVVVMRELGLTPRCLVVNLGTNDIKLDRGHLTAAALRSRLVTFLRATADIPVVVLVSAWGRQGTYMPAMGPMRHVYDQAIAAAGGGHLVDWASVAARHPEYIAEDGVHDTSSGQQARIGLLADAVETLCP